LVFKVDVVPNILQQDIISEESIPFSFFVTIAPTMRTTTVVAKLAILLLAITAKTRASEEESDNTAANTEKGFKFLHFGEGESPVFEHLPTGSDKNSEQNNDSASFSLRGNSKDSLDLPEIPPFHPVHSGSVVYSSMMEVDGTVTYRRDIHAPCDNGMLLFNVGPSKDDLPYPFDLYDDAYLYSDNGGLCILYPTYTGYQTAPYPFWSLGKDPTTVKFQNLIPSFKAMKRISSRILVPADGAPEHSKEINRSKAGDYIIMAKHDFYSIDYYKRLKQFVNSWGPNGWRPGDNDNEDGWMVLDATMGEEPTFESANSVSEVQ